MELKFPEIVYRRPEIDNVKTMFNALLSDFDAADSFEAQAVVFSKINTIRKEFQTYASLASVRNSINTKDAFYEAEQNYYDQNEPVFQDLNIKLYSSLVNSKFKKELSEKYGKQLFTIAEVSLKSFQPSIIEDLQEENRLSTEYINLMASAEIEFDGKMTNLEGLTPYEQSTDRATRKRAMEARYRFYAENGDKLDDIFDKLVKLRHKIAITLGYKNFVELGYYRMGRSDYNAEMVKVFRDQILEHVVPISVKLRERQKNRLSLDKLTVVDMPLNFLSGNATPKGSPEWILENGQKMYSELSPETKEFFDFMVKNELLDMVNRQGKAGGGYCTYFSEFKAPFIFSNFNGTSHDIDVLTHEAGHAFQCYESLHFELEEYYFPTSEACEIHSMSMELFTWPWMELFFKHDTEKYKFTHLCGSINFLPYGVAVDEFQEWVYENPEVTPAERKQAWNRIDKKYRPYIDNDGIEFLEQGGFWQRQRHIYRTPFYYIDYCLAQICAFQFWAKSQQNFDTAWQDYIRLCKAGGSQSFLELVKLAGLNSPFHPNTVQPAVQAISTWLDGVDDAKM